MIGETVSHYRILDKLGEGGMGVVYLAEDLKLGRQVALKLLPQERTASPEARARFLHEAQTAASLNHPNICTIHEVDEADGRIFLAMEHIEGKSLTERISQGPLKIADTIKIGMAIAEGLGAAHSEGVVHRDIKPGNVMLTRDGRAKVLDFGLALAPEMTRLTREGRTTGTVSYMSPEQSRGDDVDSRTDIWSLGVVLYEMLTGRRPFSGDHEHAVLHSIMNDEPEAPSGLRTGVPLELEHIISKAMAKDPADRYQHVDDIVVDLRRVERSTTSEVAPIGSASRAEAQGPPRRSSLRMAIAVSGVAIAVLAAAWVYRTARRQETAATPPLGRDVVMVSSFENRSGDPSLDYVCQAMVTALSDGLALTDVVDVLPEHQEAAQTSGEVAGPAETGASSLLQSARDIGATVLVTGSFHVRGDSLHIEARVLEAGDGRAINIIPDEVGPLANPGIAIGKTRSRVMGSLAARAQPVIGPDGRLYAPTYEAYKALEAGLRQFGIQSAVALEHFDRALELDPGFGVVWVWKVGTLLALDRYAEADSLIEAVRSSAVGLPPRGQLWMEFFGARLRGDREQALRKVREIVRLAPDDYMGRRLVAMAAISRNRPREAIDNLREIRAEGDETDLYIESWVYGGLANAYHMLGDYERELEILNEAIHKYPDLLWLWARKTRALAGLGRVDEIAEVIEEASASPAAQGTVGYILSIACEELRAHGHPEESHEYALRALRWHRDEHEREGETELSMRAVGRALYGAEQWDEALEVHEGLARQYPGELDYRGYLGTLAARAGNTRRAEIIRDSLLAIDEPYDYGMNTYWAACISAQLGRKEEAMEHLRAAHAEGVALGLHVHTDIDLQPLWDYPPFQRFLEPRD